MFYPLGADGWNAIRLWEWCQVVSDALKLLICVAGKNLRHSTQIADNHLTQYFRAKEASRHRAGMLGTGACKEVISMTRKIAAIDLREERRALLCLSVTTYSIRSGWLTSESTLMTAFPRVVNRDE